MRNVIKKITTALLLGAVTLTLTPQSAKADQYFDPFGFGNPGDLFFFNPPDIFFPTPYLLPDLIIEDIHLLQHNDERAFVKVRNIGRAKADPSHISAHNSTGFGLGNTPTLDINESRWCLLVMHNGASLKECSSVTVLEADTFMVIGEMDETNNMKWEMCQ